MILDVEMFSQLWILEVWENGNLCPGSHCVYCCGVLNHSLLPLALLLEPSTENPSTKDIEHSYVGSKSARFRLQHPKVICIVCSLVHWLTLIKVQGLTQFSYSYCIIIFLMIFLDLVSKRTQKYAAVSLQITWGHLRACVSFINLIAYIRLQFDKVWWPAWTCSFGPSACLHPGLVWHTDGWNSC